MLEDKAKRGLEVLVRNLDDKYSVVADKGMIHDINGIGHTVGIRWFFPYSKYQITDVPKMERKWSRDTGNPRDKLPRRY